MPQKEKDKWGKVLVAETMSSEESDEENEDIITVKPLHWRAEEVSSTVWTAKWKHQADSS